MSGAIYFAPDILFKIKLKIMKRKVIHILLLFCFICPNIYSYGTSAGTRITNGTDKGINGTTDIPGDSIIYYESGLSFSYNIACGNITISTVMGCYDASILSIHDEKVGNTGNEVFFYYIITNHGNISDQLRIKISEVSNTGSGLFKGNIYSIYSGTNLVSGPSSNLSWLTPLIGPDAETSFNIKIKVPTDANDQDANISLIEILNQNGTGMNDQWPGELAYGYSSPDPAGSRDYQIAYLKIKALAPLVIISKSVDYITTVSDDILTYTIYYSNAANLSASNCLIIDEIPSGTIYICDSAETNNALHNGSANVYYSDGSTWYDESFDVDISAPYIKKIRWDLNKAILTGEAGYVKFKVKIY